MSDDGMDLGDMGDDMGDGEYPYAVVSNNLRLKVHSSAAIQLNKHNMHVGAC
jgi:hypothetical protein